MIPFLTTSLGAVIMYVGIFFKVQLLPPYTTEEKVVYFLIFIAVFALKISLIAFGLWLLSLQF
jgi:hypothetical protein